MESMESKRTRIGLGESEEPDSRATSAAAQHIRTISRLLDAARIKAKLLGGILAMLALLALPALTLPGFAIFTLIGELYLMDWTYSRYSSAKSDHAKLASTKALEKDARLEDEIDKIAARTGPKEQFIR